MTQIGRTSPVFPLTWSSQKQAFIKTFVLLTAELCKNECKGKWREDELMWVVPALRKKRFPRSESNLAPSRYDTGAVAFGTLSISSGFVARSLAFGLGQLRFQTLEGWTVDIV